MLFNRTHHPVPVQVSTSTDILHPSLGLPCFVFCVIILYTLACKNDCRNMLMSKDIWVILYSVIE